MDKYLWSAQFTPSQDVVTIEFRSLRLYSRKYNIINAAIAIKRRINRRLRNSCRPPSSLPHTRTKLHLVVSSRQSWLVYLEITQKKNNLYRYLMYTRRYNMCIYFVSKMNLSIITLRLCRVGGTKVERTTTKGLPENCVPFFYIYRIR